MAFCEKGRLIKFPEASHWVHHEEAPKINELIFEFFKDSITVK
jgi:pimeloyl-ACP methyl ester carboxylesterase